MMLAIGILILGIFSRLIWHTPNFTPVIALALFGGVYLKKKHALWIPLVLMAVSDFIIGVHNIVLFTWGSVVLVSAIGLWARNRKSVKTTFITSICSAVLFFVITNFGAWLVMYPHTWEGLRNCYILAIPFFRSTLAGTLVYSVALFGIYELVARRVKETRLAKVIL